MSGLDFPLAEPSARSFTRLRNELIVLVVFDWIYETVFGALSEWLDNKTDIWRDIGPNYGHIITACANCLYRSDSSIDIALHSIFIELIVNNISLYLLLFHLSETVLRIERSLSPTERTPLLSSRSGDNVNSSQRNTTNASQPKEVAIDVNDKQQSTDSIETIRSQKHY